MGIKKAGILIDGRTVIERTLAELDRAGAHVTVLGREPVEDRPFLIDATEEAGPAAALLNYFPKSDQVFVVSCDIPFFRAEVIVELQARIGHHDAVIPLVGDRPQYLCALYTAGAFEKWRRGTPRPCPTPPEWRGVSMYRLVAMVDAVETDDIDQRSITGVNTPEELRRLRLNT